MLNKAMLIGNLGADPEVRYMQDGTCVCNINIATTESWKNRDGEKQEHTEWHRVALWGKLGEIASQYLKKGSRVYIEGRIETRKWQDRDGNERYSTNIRAREMKMLSGRNDDRGTNPAASSPAPGPENKPAVSNDPFADAPNFNDVPVDDDIPF